MSPQHDPIRSMRVETGSSPRLEHRDPGVRVGAPNKEAGLVRLQELVDRLSTLHNRLFAEGEGCQNCVSLMLPLCSTRG